MSSSWVIIARGRRLCIHRIEPISKGSVRRIARKVLGGASIVKIYAGD